jgi:hypothetical protein
MLGNDIYPSSVALVAVSYILLFLGALVNAHIFGTIAVIIQGFDGKAKLL